MIALVTDQIGLRMTARKCETGIAPCNLHV